MIVWYYLLLALILSSAAASAQPRIAIAQFTHESNSFNPANTTYEDFAQRPLQPIGRLLVEWRKNNDDVSGYLDGAETHRFDVYPVLLANATPKGPLTDQAYEAIVRELIRRLKTAPRLDGLLIALHGAMVTQSIPHADLETARRLREAMGPKFPIIVTHDFHANVHPDMAKYVTALITYKEVPHLDPRQRGQQAAAIMAGVVAGKLKPTVAIVKPALMLNIVFHNTSREPLKPIVDESRRLEKNPKILACSVPGGYQYADVPYIGPSVIVVTDNDPALAKREAERLSKMLEDLRPRLKFNVPDAAHAVPLAMASKKEPVVLVEMGDNIGGGSSGDATFVLSELIKQKASGWVVVLADPEAVKTAARAAIGGAFDGFVGGKQDRLHGDPVRVKGVVRVLTDGRYIETEVRHGGGRYFDQGLTAVLEVEGGTRDQPNLVMLTTKRQVPFSIHQLVQAGIYPQRQKILVVKAAVAFRAAYEPIAGEIIEVDTPGSTAVNPARFTYKRVREGLFGMK